VRDPERVQAAMAAVVEQRGRLDLLVNNAAGNFYVPSESMSPNAWRSVVEIDLYGTFFCSQAALPHMRASGGGSIINISMTLHYRGWPQMAHATAAKGGIDALTKTLAVEWASDRVRVNAVAPGPIPTEGVLKAFARPPAGKDLFGANESPTASSERITSESVQREAADRVRVAIEQRARQIPLARWGTPRDIANAVVFLASPAASWITGAILVVDGGEWLARSTA
jgi:2,4-dienoyl-CoA reductase [(3E)-enoyl-CoA-producing], peroxisomal